MRRRGGGAALVLVIDDGGEARDLYRACLEYRGFLAETAEDGFAGIEAANSVRPDIILLDFSMPGMDGAEVLRRLKASPRTSSIPVVMLTAVPDLVPVSTRTRCAAFFEKPCEPDRLLDEIARLLSLRERPRDPHSREG